MSLPIRPIDSHHNGRPQLWIFGTGKTRTLISRVPGAPGLDLQTWENKNLNQSCLSEISVVILSEDRYATEVEEAAVAPGTASNHNL
jgi:hypothetical protein